MRLIQRCIAAAALSLAGAAAVLAVVPAPAAALPIETIPSVVCDGDGTSGKRVQLQYSYLTDNRFAEREDYLRTLASEVSRYFDHSARKTGGNRHVRYVHDSSCDPVIEVFQRTSSSNVFEYSEEHHTDPDRFYLQYLEDASVCGVAIGQWAGVEGACAEADTAAHELAHLLGAVRYNQGPGGTDHPPHGTRNGHCYDGIDLLCYDDDSPDAPPQQMVCPNHWGLFDCNNDDYFHTNPPGGSFLADPNHINIADSDYLIKTGSVEEGGPVAGQDWLIGNVGTSAAREPKQLTPQGGSDGDVPILLVNHGGAVEASQGWTLERADSWTWRFVNRDTGKCLMVDGTTPGSEVRQATCNPTSVAQQFTLNHYGLGRYVIQLRDSGLVLTPDNLQNTDGNAVFAEYYTGSYAQQWIFTLAALLD